MGVVVARWMDGWMDGPGLLQYKNNRKLQVLETHYKCSFFVKESR